MVPPPPVSRSIGLGSMLAVASLLGGCRNGQSVFSPHSDVTEYTAELTIILLAGGAVIFIAVMALVALAIIGSERTRAVLAQPTAIFSGGVVFPVVVLTALLVYGLILIRVEAGAATEPLEISVEGERWWWRISYKMPDGSIVETANELRLPVGRQARISLTTADVIHSFWLPELAGKVDMIPGRTNKLHFRPNRAGTFRGQCAEYCGGAHALMGLRAVVLEPDRFAAWLEKQRAPAAALESAEAQRGREGFVTRGCPACHTVTGHQAVGRIGPNLTHIGSRHAIAAERLPMSKENLKRWIRHNDRLKPDNLMPSYAEVPDAEIDAIATYLAGLK